MITFNSKFDIGDRVWIDGEGSINGTVTALSFSGRSDATVEVSWFHNGDAKSAWFREWRLTASK